MSSDVTEEEQQLIDEAVEAGMVTKIKRGESAWQIIEGVSLSPGVRGPLRDKVLGLIARRQLIRTMVLAGMSDAGIKGQYRDIRQETIQKDIRTIRFSIDPTQPRKNGNTVRVEAMRSIRREKVKACIARDMTITQIAKEVGSTTCTVRADCKHLGLEPPMGYKGPKDHRNRRKLG
jgi:hypothetical protein